MKRLLLLISFLFVGLTTLYSQKMTNISCYATSTSIYNEFYDSYGEWSIPIKYNCTITYGTNTVDIVGDKKLHINVLSMDKITYYNDYSYFPMTCLDQYNKNCAVHTYYFYNDNKYEIVLQYWDFMIKYYCILQ